MSNAQTLSAKASADAQARSDAWMKDAQLARSKGNTPEQVDARRRVARLFCEMHLPDEKPPERDARLARIDDTQPLFTNNARNIDVNNPKSAGFLGLRRRPAYIVSVKFPPKTADDPVYALEYIPLNR